MKNIVVSRLPIKLGQFLQLANFAQDGLDAKHIISEGRVTVNGEVENRRGRKLYKDDKVEVDGDQSFLVYSEV